jgi:1-acyl-sn-glycerol-3-phosphate acyltransferase
MDYRIEPGAVPSKGPAIVVANHACFLDPWLFGVVTFPRVIHFLINHDWYNKSAPWRAFFDGHGVIPIEPKDPALTVEKVCNALGEGKVVGVFPEGRISYDGRIRRFRSGVARIAAVSGAPVIPVGVHGAYESLPRTKKFPRPRKVTVRVGAPLRYPGSPCQDPSLSDLMKFRDRTFCEVCRLSGQEERIPEVLSNGSTEPATFPQEPAAASSERSGETESPADAQTEVSRS